ncbi:MAG: YciI family protein [Arenicellales bacterium]|jgi:hypothetical protein|nr:hypothetical protein [Acidiferrobacteraceae bacterium]MDP6122717.1 YciI family protein [Arenicellales bacterium]MDP7283565.1 YciI family protein [Arenicellales bacterium]MDP7481653.1 YciI family protein [Arenicellales bacterium]|tara:strand:+ start:150 stop:449 length:300 start_codon:yes stop_codon:yes gene_type:complete
MLYAIIGHDVVNSLEHRQQARSQHLLRLEDLRDQGRLVLAGPFPSVDGIDPGPAGFTGSLIIAEFETLEAATEWADGDPYVAAGVYDRVEVKPFKKALP